MLEGEMQTFDLSNFLSRTKKQQQFVLNVYINKDLADITKNFNRAELIFNYTVTKMNVF